MLSITLRSMNKPIIIQGGTIKDFRGEISFINDFNMDEVKRMYLIEPLHQYVRAWQGHKNESKWFMPLTGSFEIVLIEERYWGDLSNKTYERFILCANRKEVLFVPGGYANGFRSIDKKSKMIVFSNFNLEESKRDDYRFDSNLWYNW